MAGASIPELLDYPVITERLRDALSRRYQFLLSRTVTIADPSVGVEPHDIRAAAREGQQLARALEAGAVLKQRTRQELLAGAGVRKGLQEQMSYEGSPYMLHRDWARSVTEALSDDAPFGIGVWGATGPSAVDLAARMLTGELPRLSRTAVTLDIGFDISRSMMLDDRGGYAYTRARRILTEIRGHLNVVNWRLWMISDDTTLAARSERGYSEEPLATVMNRAGVRSGETRFAPFFRTMLSSRPDNGSHLCILLTDGECSDRPETLRYAERLARSGSEYLQIVLHRDDDYREYVRRASGVRGVDNIMDQSDLADGDLLHVRSDEELRAAVHAELQKVTDIAEAAHGGQIVLTYFPLFELMAIDVYERYLGKVLLG
jgi:hypothetical protein